MPIPAGSGPWPYVVTLTEVKEHGNITSTASDTELEDFIGTAQQMVEDLVGPTVPQTVTQTWYGGQSSLSLSRLPVLSVESVTEYGSAVDSGLYVVDPVIGEVFRADGRGWYGRRDMPVVVAYTAGRDPVPAAIRWGIKELAIHLWRSTQTQRGGRARGDVADLPAGYGLPNRVREALAPFLLVPAVG